MAEPLLEVSGLCVDFRTRTGVVRAVDGVSFSVGAGEVVGLVGESGSGKTLTMLSVLGLIADPNAVVSGSIRFAGRELLTAGGQRAWRGVRGRRIAMVFQDSMSALNPVHTIGWQITEQIRAHLPLGRAAARSRALGLLERMGVAAPEQVFTRYPHQLSGGLRQRAVIAMALSCDPSLLIADEPTTALDVTVQAQILALLRGLRDSFGSSILLVTHDMGVVAELADTVMVMYAGRLAEHGPVADVLARPAHPYTQGLLASIPPMTGPPPRRLAAIPGAPPSPAERPHGCAFGPRCALRFGRCAARPPLLARGRQQAACFLLEAAA